MTRKDPVVSLHPFGPPDFARLIAWVTDGGSQETLLYWAGPIFTWPLDEGQLESYVEPALSEPPVRVIWRADDASGAPVGHIELNAIDRLDRSAVLSRVLVAPDHRGRGVGRAMAAAALDLAFAELRLRRVVLNVFESNTPARRCYKSLGFAQEGSPRDILGANGGNLRTLRMSLLDDEWVQRCDREEVRHAV